MAAVRVPPSATSTSQSTMIVCSPSVSKSMAARSERPIRRWISWVRPPTRPRSRVEREWVERGSMAYSAVTQPRPLRLRQSGTPSSTDAVQSTWVRPNRTVQEPSA